MQLAGSKAPPAGCTAFCNIGFWVAQRFKVRFATLYADAL